MDIVRQRSTMGTRAYGNVKKKTIKGLAAGNLDATGGGWAGQKVNTRYEEETRI